MGRFHNPKNTGEVDEIDWQDHLRVDPILNESFEGFERKGVAHYHWKSMIATGFSDISPGDIKYLKRLIINNKLPSDAEIWAVSKNYIVIYSTIDGQKYIIKR